MDVLPDEIIEKILLDAVSSENSCETYRNILNVNKRFKRIIEEKGKYLLPEIHVSSDELLQKIKMRNEKIKISILRLKNEFGESRGLLQRICEIVNNKSWKSAWLLLTKGKKKNWYVIDHVYWKQTKRSVPVVIIAEDQEYL